MNYIENLNEHTSSLESDLDSYKHKLASILLSMSFSETRLQLKDAKISIDEKELTRLGQVELDLQAKENELNSSRRICTQQGKLIEQLCANMRKMVACKVCHKIFAEPIELPCTNSVCKSHLT